MKCEHLNQQVKGRYRFCLDCRNYIKRHKVSTPTHVKTEDGKIAEITNSSSDSYTLDYLGHYFFYPKSKTTPIRFKNYLVY